MDNIGREKFWNVLLNLHDNTPASVDTLMKAYPWPKTLCRFRSVSQDSLQQLNDNKQLFSSPDHYDDPFDTYCYINIDEMVQEYDNMRLKLSEGDNDLFETLQKLATAIRWQPNFFIDELNRDSLDFDKVKGRLRHVPESIKKKLFSICFCEDPYNETLWIKYAGNYSGFVQVYDLEDPNTFLCGKETYCQNCRMSIERPSIYPVYYSDTRYDATKYAVGTFLIDKIMAQNDPTLVNLYNLVSRDLMWEAERVSLIKKKCHENDQEWRMIRPAINEQRSCIKMKPSMVIIGLRTPDYESRLIVSAAVNAGIKSIHKLYINDSDILDSKPVEDGLYHI